MEPSRHVVIIGAGIVGAATALECLQLGHQVTILEPEEPGGEQAATYGNGCWLYPSSILPMSTPDLWKQIPGFLLDPSGPFVIRWRHLLRLSPWLLRFVWAGSSLSKIECTAHARRALTANTVGEHTELAIMAGVPHLLLKQGLLHVYKHRTDFLANSLELQMRQKLSIKFIELDNDALHELEPSIGPEYTFGVLSDDGAHLVDPGAYCRALVRCAEEKGAVLLAAKAVDFEFKDSQLQGVRTDDCLIACNKAIICAGVQSKVLASRAGANIPLESERGYHVVISEPEVVLRHPVMPNDGKMGVTSTPQGMRIAGQVELASFDAVPDWRRAQILLEYLPRLIPEMPAVLDPSRLKFWMGHRPSTPDGLPCLGYSPRSQDVLFGFGHGHTGLTMAPSSAKLLAALANETLPPFDPSPYSPQRF